MIYHFPIQLSRGIYSIEAKGPSEEPAAGLAEQSSSTMSAPFIVAVPKKQPLQQGTKGRAELDLVASVTECENAPIS